VLPIEVSRDSDASDDHGHGMEANVLCRSKRLDHLKMMMMTRRRGVCTKNIRICKQRWNRLNSSRVRGGDGLLVKEKVKFKVQGKISDFMLISTASPASSAHMVMVLDH
jgi:hypothetical protein